MTILFYNFRSYYDSWLHLQFQLDDKAVLHLEVGRHECENFLVILVDKSSLWRADKWREQYQQNHILLMPVPNFEGEGISIWPSNYERIDDVVPNFLRI